MNCPTCNIVITKCGWCSHIIGNYYVRYDLDLDYGVKTEIYKRPSDGWEEPLLVLDGIVAMTPERIEKLLVIK